MTYDLRPMKGPRAAGEALRVLATVLENPVTGKLLQWKLLRDAGIVALRSTPVSEPLPVECSVPGSTREKTRGPMPDLWEVVRVPQKTSHDGFETAADFVKAYREGNSTPIEVAKRAIEAIERDDRRHPPMRVFISKNSEEVLAQAEASTERWRKGKPLGPLDGVPVAVKDELDQKGLPTTVGTRFLGTHPATDDAEVVARLRRAGAMLLGKTNMHEIGMGVTGLNPHHGAVRNPYDPARATGGSSSGSAAAVAAGYCPLAVGADGGGSIRIPAALCGVVGLKPTFGRVSERGAAPLCWTVAHVGPIGATVRDVALGYAVMAGRDPRDPSTASQPAPDLDGFEDESLKGVRLGVYRAWFEDADPGVVSVCWEMVKALRDAGADIVEIEIPELALARAVHLVTIVSEMAASQLPYYELHRTDYGLDTRVNLALARALTAYDYVQAQRHRARIRGHYVRLFEQVDAIVTPATGCTAPMLLSDALQTGESNLAVVDRIMRFAVVANLTGLPAITFPAGYDERGLPVGFQVMGRAWEESLLLRIARVGEARAVRKLPRVHHRLLGSRNEQ